MRELARAGVLVGFCGGGGTPLYSATEREIEVVWINPQSEYRPTEFLQRWVHFWFDDACRLQAAKRFQSARLSRVQHQWSRLASERHPRFQPDLGALAVCLDQSAAAISAAPDGTALLTEEARLTKKLYRLASEATSYGDFARSKRGEGADIANQFLDHGNYLAYGLGATATWVLGLPHGLAVLHGKTRRGGLVFDVADLVKDASILPQAFVSAVRGDTEQEFRQACIEALARSEALDFMIDTVKATAFSIGRIGTSGSAS